MKRKQMEAELIKRLEIRLKQLYGQSKYPIHSGHHARDVLTMLAFLERDKRFEKLIGQMPTENDLKEETP